MSLAALAGVGAVPGKLVVGTLGAWAASHRLLETLSAACGAGLARNLAGGAVAGFPRALHTSRATAAAADPALASSPLEGEAPLDLAYRPLRILGKGLCGEVWLRRDLATGELRAFKLMRRPLPADAVDQLCNEIMIQAGVGAGHVGICHLREVLIAPTHTALALDYAAGGTVFGAIEERAQEAARTQQLCLPEPTAQFMFKQLLSTVAFLHRNHIAHRDIKLENTLLDGGHPPRLWLSDFQFAQHWGPEEAGRMNVRLGTPAYMAPEVLANLYSRRPVDPARGDVWACGVWLAALLTGSLPYSCAPSNNQAEMAQQILRQQLRRTWRGSTFARPVVAQLSAEAVDLLDGLLHLDPRQRITAAEALEHPWMRRSLPSELASAWEGLQEEQAGLQAKLSKKSAEQAVVCDEQGNCSVLRLVRAASTPPPAGPAVAAPLVRIDCTDPSVVASLRDALG